MPPGNMSPENYSLKNCPLGKLPPANRLPENFPPGKVKCRNTLLSKISENNNDLITRSDLTLIKTLLFGNNSFSQYDNSRNLDSTIAFIVRSKIFNDPLLV